MPHAATTPADEDTVPARARNAGRSEAGGGTAGASLSQDSGS
jgi:hypothetical protein